MAPGRAAHHLHVSTGGKVVETVLSERTGEGIRCPKGSPGFKADTPCAPGEIALMPAARDLFCRRQGVGVGPAGQWLSLAFTGCAH